MNIGGKSLPSGSFISSVDYSREGRLGAFNNSIVKIEEWGLTILSGGKRNIEIRNQVVQINVPVQQLPQKR